MKFWVAEIICVLAQLLLFIPFYCVWVLDCKRIGKENLAVPLSERFIAWCLLFPMWFVPILCAMKGR